MAPAVLHPLLVLTLTLSLCQPRPSLSPLSLTLTQSSRASDDARTDVTAPRPAPPGTCYRPSRIILFPVWYSWPLYESGTRRVSSLLEDARTQGVSQVEFDNKSGFEIHTSLTADCILKGKDVRDLENMP